MDSMVRGRVWPDGTFCLWRNTPGEQSDPEAASPIGLSKVANSHKILLSPEDPLQRGVRGITNYGQRMVSNAAYLLQQKFGGAKLSFLTCTLPGSSEDTLRAASNWADIVRVFLQWLKRRLEKEGLSLVIASVTEIQPKRMRSQGGLPLHLHMVFQGAHRDYQWCLGPTELTVAWRRAIVGRVPALATVSFASALNIQHVRQSAANYLGKYMSKGEEDICQLLDECPDLIHYLPNTWYNLSKEARDVVKANTAEGQDVGLTLERWAQWKDDLDSPFKYIQRVALRCPEGYEIKTFYIGQVAAHWKRLLGIPVSPHDIVGL